ncbi:MAG: hypothetical protein DRJ40_01765 [Thermoprotei archaeon]|nr:MAG: hypothetical protein DRJ40_01765 [Thermoprotei archaeon]
MVSHKETILILLDDEGAEVNYGAELCDFLVSSGIEFVVAYTREIDILEGYRDYTERCKEMRSTLTRCASQFPFDTYLRLESALTMGYYLRYSARELISLAMPQEVM